MAQTYQLVTNQRETTIGRYSDFAAYPTTEAGWRDRYDRLWAMYLGVPYDAGECKQFHLFRALDDNGQEIDQAKRLTTLFKFVTDTDVGGLLGGKVTLQESEGADDDAMLADARAVWKRSKADERIEAWARTVAVMGDVYIEPVRQSGVKPYRTTLVVYDPRNVNPTYDGETGSRLVGGTITTHYLDPDTVAADGTVTEGALHTYRREVDEVEIRVFRDGVLSVPESGPHGLGMCPLVHVQWQPFTEPDHGLPAAHGLDTVIMRLDSLYTQFGAAATRTANPIGVMKGAKLGADSDVGRLGRWISGLPADGSAEYLEPTGTGMRQILDGAKQLMDHVQATEPEFLFADTGAVSGEARSYKAAAFENKIGNARVRFFGGLARAVYYAVCLDRDEACDPDAEPLCCEAGPILPRNVKAEVETLNGVKHLKAEDYVRHMQRLGIVPADADPDDYASEVRDQMADTVGAFYGDPTARPRPPMGRTAPVTDDDEDAGE